MSQSGYTPISLYYSSTASAVPTAGNLVAGELALNNLDGKLFYKDSAGAVQVIGTKGGVGSSTTTQVLYNSSGLVVGSANMTFNGTTFTLANDASISGLTVGKGGGSVSGNSAFGVTALTSNTTGGQNTAIGYAALYANTTGNYNTAIGALDGSSQPPLRFNTTGSYNIAVGNGALQANTTASYNTAVGYQAGYTQTTADRNAILGTQAGYLGTTGSANAFVGYQAGYANTTGFLHASLGAYALTANTTGVQNTAIGGYSLSANTTGQFNVGVGTYALQANTTASNNTAVGYQAGYGITTGGNNVCIGNGSGSNITTGQYNLMFGNGTVGGAADVFEIVLSSNGAAGKGSSTGLISPNGGGVYQGNNSAAWSITSDQRLKKNIVDNTTGLSAINAIQVRNFEYRTANEVTELEPQNAIDIKGVQLGAIAQELQAILPDCVKTESTGVMSVDASNLTWYLINAVKELNAKVTALEAQLGK